MKHAFFLLSIFLLFSSAPATGLDEAVKLFENKEYEHARRVLEAILKQDEDNAAACYYLARIHYGKKDYDTALDYAERAVELKPSIAEYHFVYANVMGAIAQKANVFKQGWLAPKILEQFEKTIELDSTHIGGHIGAANFYLMAPGFMGGDIGKAREQAFTLLRLGSEKGRWLLIAIYKKEGRFEKVEEQYDLLVKSFPDSGGRPGLFNDYGYYLLKRGKKRKALKMFKRLVSLTPDVANSYDSLGDGYRALGDVDSALINYRKALSLDPGFEASSKKISELETH